MNQAQKIKSGKIAKFTQTTIQVINTRDKYCILCKLKGKISMINDRHHVYFGLDAELNKDYRNNSEKGIGVCRSCHELIHKCKMGKGLRQVCVNYVFNINKKTVCDEQTTI